MKEEFNPLEVGKELKRLREEKHIPASWVGKHFGKDTRTIYRWETGSAGLTAYFAQEYRKLVNKEKTWEK